MSADRDAPLSAFSPDAPDWMACDLAACRTLQTASEEIVSTCRQFGSQLAGICGKATQQIPSSGAKTDQADADLCQKFLWTFGMLSSALVCVAGDLESTVIVPLQASIAKLQEESSGRIKHWQQVRGRFAELMERYGRSRQRSIEAKEKLAQSASAGSRGSFWRKLSQDGKAAAEQHSAMCDLAKCEEELLRSEVSLRKLEEESRERLAQLETEKNEALQGAITKGASSLKRLLPISARARQLDEVEVPCSDGWSGVLPPSAGAAPPQAMAFEEAEEKDLPWQGGSEFNDILKPQATSSDHVACESGSTPAEFLARAGAGVEASEDDGNDPHTTETPSNRFDSYLPTASESADFAELDEVIRGHDGDGEMEDAAARAQNWSLGVNGAKTVSRPFRRKRSLVFQKDDSARLVRPESSSPAGVPSSCVRQGSNFSAISQSCPSVAALAVSQSISEGRRTPMSVPVAAAAPFTLNSVSSFQGSGKAAGSTIEDEISFGIWNVPTLLSSPSASIKGAKREESDDECLRKTESKRSTVALLDLLEYDLGLSPLLTEDPRREFELYVQRLDGRLAQSMDTCWERLSKTASEHLQGAHAGKLEFWWIHAPGKKASPELADGLVCFQFVQSCATNFARILHLSVVSHEDGWSAVLPSAILEVRRLIFGTLPVDAVRAAVLALEDESGRTCVDEEIEVAFNQCGFRWFQLTQDIRRTSSKFRRKQKSVATRNLVLNTYRSKQDPEAPYSEIRRLPSLLLQDSVLSSPAGHAAETPVADVFSAF